MNSEKITEEICKIIQEEKKSAWNEGFVAGKANRGTIMDAYASMKDDATNWGEALNDASWLFLEQYTKHSGTTMTATLLNSHKSLLRDCILKYLEVTSEKNFNREEPSTNNSYSREADLIKNRERIRQYQAKCLNDVIRVTMHNDRVYQEWRKDRDSSANNTREYFDHLITGKHMANKLQQAIDNYEIAIIGMVREPSVNNG